MRVLVGRCSLSPVTRHLEVVGRSDLATHHWLRYLSLGGSDLVPCYRLPVNLPGGGSDLVI
jgi:hypothetical protein